MKNMELEVKILNVDKKKLIEKLEGLGAEKISKDIEKMYVYDLFGMNSRFNDILFHLNFYSDNNINNDDIRLKKSYNEQDELKYETAMERLKNLFIEIDYLLTKEETKYLKDSFYSNNLMLLCKKKNIVNMLNGEKFKNFINKFFLNRNKWMRLREVNGKALITIKHILPDKGMIQQIEETEVVVENFDDANDFLEAIGYRYKNYFEKERIKYSIYGYEIDIDTWPEIPTYFEIEGANEENLVNIIEKLGYKKEDILSATANKIFELYGKSMFDNREMKF